jgi:hypothetical protein
MAVEAITNKLQEQIDVEYDTLDATRTANE